MLNALILYVDFIWLCNLKYRIVHLTLLFQNYCYNFFSIYHGAILIWRTIHLSSVHVDLDVLICFHLLLLFQFNDKLLLCQSVPVTLGIKQQYKVKVLMDIDGMQVKVNFQHHNNHLSPLSKPLSYIPQPFGKQ